MRLQFNYNNYIVSKNMKINNPLKICHEGKCITNITAYKIKKGKSYKIYISTNVQDNGLEYGLDYILYLPAFSFNFIKKEEKKEEKQDREKYLDFNNLSSLEIYCIIIISILIIIAIGLCCFLFCRKSRKPNNEIRNNKFIELETIK